VLEVYFEGQNGAFNHNFQQGDFKKLFIISVIDQPNLLLTLLLTFNLAFNLN
jgi:hypothetical protein